MELGIIGCDRDKNLLHTDSRVLCRTTDPSSSLMLSRLNTLLNRNELLIKN